ncbi:ImmA/IrrE family metallo-endopeptidase [Pseudoxanthomonas mexicana]|uniref:ImmA/IrrE family metallo-endopeptidase n=1 Tax=Pseudoxanthomonas mexicana TaxID=128785 RepID=A0ABX6RDA4_PSEMX|nr:ImmA/IrrE family metallo-endopeptidase [Pseudoxanthomonas mexicana]QND80529.1 ImmA/IrrE family metallo-endopeptidase [Pseudoxanthomonas mexicana]
MDELVAIGRARKLVEGILSPPVDVQALIAAHGMVFKESDRLGPDEAGNTVTKGGTTYIVVNRNDDPFRRRFTALHELAHNLLELPSKHTSGVPSDELERYAGRPPEEKICDVFAAECLVPAHLIKPLIANASFSVDLLIDLTKKFQASRQCIASSFVRNSKDLVAYVYAEEGATQRVIPSAALRATGIFVQGGLLPSSSAAFNAMQAGIGFDSQELDASDWSSSDVAIHYACYEEALFVPAWKQTHSLLTFEAVASSIRNVEAGDDSDGLLAELTGHLPWPKR